jgi:IS1 family transposase
VANVIKPEKRVQILRLLAEGNSVRSTARLTDSEHRTVLRHLVIAGEECRGFLHDNLVELNVRHVECDEIWTFVAKKQKRVTAQEVGNQGIGDQYLFVALDQDTKLICTYAIGKRDGATTQRFMDDLSRRIVIPGFASANAIRPQVSTDAFASYDQAVASAFGRRVNYGQIVKMYRPNAEAGRYAPSALLSVTRRPMWGPIEPRSICTSLVERNNLTIRTFLRRFTRLSLGFSKKLANLRAAVALHVFHYNFCRIHGRLKRTPAMAAGVTERLWSIADLFG